MRILTEEELESVFGGADAQTAVKLAPVTVNASIVANPSYTFSIGSGFTPTGYGEAGVACYWNGVPGAISHLPSSEHIRCVLSKTAIPSYDLAPGYLLNVVNNFAFGDPNLQQPTSALKLDIHHNVPAGQGEIMGVTQDWRSGAPYNVVTLFAGALSSFPGGSAYTELSSGLTKTVPSLNSAEMTVFVAAHEASHSVGIGAQPSDEMTANGFGMYAVEQYRAGVVGNQCPNGS